MVDIGLEVLQAMVVGGIVLYLYRSRESQVTGEGTGWRRIRWGFGLILFGSLLDIASSLDEGPLSSLSGDPAVSVFLRDVVGYFGGFVLIAAGLTAWVPRLRQLSAEIAGREAAEVALRRAHDELRKAHDDLEVLVEERTQELRESERQLATFIDHLSGAAFRCLIDERWTMLMLSEGIHGLTGYHADEIVVNRVVAYHDLVHPEDRERVRTSADEAIAEGGRYDTTYRIIARDGTEKHIWEQGSVASGPSGEPAYIEGMISDISEAKRFEAELEESRELLQALADNSPQFISFRDTRGRYQFVNQRFLDWMQMEMDAVIGKTVHDLFGNKLEADRYHKLDQEAIARRAVTSTEMDVTYPDGKQRSVISVRFPIQASGGQLLGIGCTNIDISERKRFELTSKQALLEAERANRAKSEFLATMSHEFRTPLNAILGFSEMLRGEYFGPIGTERYKEYADDIHSSGAHMLSLINDILDISAIEAGKRHIEMEHLDLVELIEGAVKSLQPGAEASGIRLVTEIADELPRIYADRRSVTQILLNVISNAIKFTSREGRITVTAQATGLHMIIKVADTGIGIPPDILPVVTKPFSQSHNDPHLTQQGSGLGLSIVQSLVDAHNGTLDIKSALGKGTEITITLPIG